MLLIVHGGAGERRPTKNALKKLSESLSSGYEILRNEGAAIDAVVKSITILEDSGLFNAGSIVSSYSYLPWSVAGTVNGLGEILALRTSRAPDRAIADADRLECLLFYGYDPYFEDDEPPGL